MTFDPKEARALVERLVKYTPGPWKYCPDEDDIPGFREPARVEIGGKSLPIGSMTKNGHDARLIAAAPDLHAHLIDALAEIERLRGLLDAIAVYTSDTLQGPVDPRDDTRDWQRAAVATAYRRARAALKGPDQ